MTQHPDPEADPGPSGSGPWPDAGTGAFADPLPAGLAAAFAQFAQFTRDRARVTEPGPDPARQAEAEAGQ